MREILFRGKRVHNGEWVCGWYTMFPYGNWPLKASIISSEKAENGEYCYAEVIPETVGQWTGLYDKNGQKIFEGDIVKATNSKNCDIFFVDYKLSSFCANKFGSNYSYVLGDFIRFTQIEVIGNIHDNPELLEKEMPLE